MPRPPWTPEQLKLLELYPELGPTVLAPLLGKKMHTVAAYATKRGLRANDPCRGGTVTREKYGRDHYVNAGRRGGGHSWRCVAMADIFASTAENREPFRMSELQWFRKWLSDRPNDSRPKIKAFDRWASRQK